MTVNDIRRAGMLEAADICEDYAYSAAIRRDGSVSGSRS